MGFATLMALSDKRCGLSNEVRDTGLADQSWNPDLTGLEFHNKTNPNKLYMCE